MSTPLPPRLSFFLGAHNNFLKEIAKFWAARRMWARFMSERFGAKNREAAVLGESQSLHSNSLDEALALPTEEAVTIALRTQQIIAYESGVAEVVDPLGGSYCVEALTTEIERRAEEYIRRIDEMGGAPKAIEAGFIQREIADAAYQYQKEIEEKRRIIVGLNEFTVEESPFTEILRISPEVERYQKEKLERVKKERNTARVKETLKRLREAAEGTENLMPHILEAVKAYATLGEIADTLREVFGEHTQLTTII